MAARLTLDQALERLLYERRYRQALFDERWGELGLSDEDLAALATVDRDQLAQTAERVRDGILRRRYRGSGGLAERFPDTLSAWREAHPEDPALHELTSRFVESPAFRRFRELPWAGGLGCCLEEAFFDFCEVAGVGRPEVREREAVVAVIRALAASGPAAFSPPDWVCAAPAGGWFAVARRGAGPVLAAAVAGRVVEGPITPFVADLLHQKRQTPPESVASAHGVSREVLREAEARLARLGLYGAASPSPRRRPGRGRRTLP